MRIRTIIAAGAGLAFAAASAPAAASGEALAAGAALPIMGKAYSGPKGGGMGMQRPPLGGGWNGGKPGGWNGSRPGGWNGGQSGGGAHRWGSRPDGRWHAGWRAPGGWNGYRRPSYGYVLPSYWVNPSYYVGNYGAYGLPAPAYGYNWSRYYDDAVMADRYGRVYDYRSNVDWGRYEGGYDDGYYDDDATYRRQDSGIGGAAIGAVVGGIAGNRIAGRGHRTTGTLIGAGVGAVAGYAIDKAEDAPRRGAPPPRSRPGAGYDYGYPDDSVTTNNDYQGRWVGTWYGRDGTTYSGEYEGGFEGTARGSYGADYDAPPYQPAPAYHGPSPSVPAGGYVSGGYYYPAPTVTTVVVQPATTTTTTYVTEEVVYRKPAARRRVIRRSCTCK